MWLSRVAASLLTLTSGVALGADGSDLPPAEVDPCLSLWNAPSTNTCRSDTWMKTCGTQWPNDQNHPCWAINKASAESWQSTNYPSAISVKYETFFDPALQGFRESLPPLTVGLATTLDQTSGGSWAAKEEEAKFLAAQIPQPVPIWYTRPVFQWANGITGCESYVYKSFYTAERWIDAINACKSDDRCKVNASLHGMTPNGPSTPPGIARLTMQDFDSSPISDRLNFMVDHDDLDVGAGDPFSDDYTLTTVPKNTFYTQSHNLLTKTFIDAFKLQTGVDLQVLHNDLWRGSTLYQVTNAPVFGGLTFVGLDGKAQRGFKDEWEFHDFMNKKTADVTDGQFREYRKRADEFYAGWNLLTDKLQCRHSLLPGGGCSLEVPNAMGKLSPGDEQMWENDPFAAREILASIQMDQFLMPPAMFGMIGFGDKLQQTGLTVGEIEAAIASGDILSGSDLIGASMNLPGLVISQPTAMPMSGTLQKQTLSTAALLLDPAITKATAVDTNRTAPDDTERAANREASVKGRTPIVPPGPSVHGPAPYHDPFHLAGPLSLPTVIDHLWETNPPRIDLRGPWPRLDCNIRSTSTDDGETRTDTRTDTPPLPTGGLEVDNLFHTEQIWKETCDLTNRLLDEYGRHMTGKPSCVDPKNLACDWQPKDFVDRFVTKNVGYATHAKEAEYRYCKRWTNSDKLPVPLEKRWNLTLFRSELEARKSELYKLLKNVPVRAENDFGTTRYERETIGDSDFGGGYLYTLSWHAEAYDWDEAQNNQICRMGGSALANFYANATLFGNDVPILDALASVSSNDNDSGEAYGNTHLYVLGYKIFDTKDHDDADAEGDILLSTINGSHDQGFVENENEKELFQVPFQVGWVTITVKAGISYGYGIRGNFVVDVPKPGSCNINSPVFKAEAKFAPYADLGAWVAADASLAGLIGVGVQVDLTLVGLELPLKAKVWLEPKNGNMSVKFNCTLDLVLTTLAGELSFYIELFWTKVASFTIIEWEGFRYKLPIFRTKPVAVELYKLLKGTIKPIEGEKCEANDCICNKTCPSTL